ncbi:MAG: hypothetical protein CME62_04235 [Halobacteriovoraceae bacterium]|nr:hypothetical protein [Halobacteriovoraceae bacterium]
MLRFLLSTLVLLNFAFANELKEQIHLLALENHRPVKSYRIAREIVFQKIYLENKSNYFIEDVYCQKTFTRNIGPNNMPHHRMINIEHAWPRSQFRVPKGSKAYRIRLADLHALYPTDSRSNSIRSSHKFANLTKGDEVKGCEKARFGRVLISGELGFEPPHEIKGDIARSLFYFATRYKRNLSHDYEATLRDWHAKDPVDAFELSKHNQIKELQGNSNPFVEKPHLVESIKDF